MYIPRSYTHLDGGNKPSWKSEASALAGKGPNRLTEQRRDGGTAAQSAHRHLTPQSVHRGRGTPTAHD